jgi:hypothetical protein
MLTRGSVTSPTRIMPVRNNHVQVTSVVRHGCNDSVKYYVKGPLCRHWPMGSRCASRMPPWFARCDVHVGSHCVLGTLVALFTLGCAVALLVLRGRPRISCRP